MAPRRSSDDNRYNFEMAVRASYDVRGWEPFLKELSDASSDIFESFEKEMKAALQDLKPEASGPGPHPHRTDHGFRWEDTGAMADSVFFTRKREGYRHTLQAHTTSAYGVWLEIGFHPMIPTGKGPGAVRRSGNFYRYPWLSTALATAVAQTRVILRTRMNKASKNLLSSHPGIMNPTSSIIANPLKLEGSTRAGGARRRDAATGRYISNVFHQIITADVNKSQGFTKPLVEKLTRQSFGAQFFAQTPRFTDDVEKIKRAEAEAAAKKEERARKARLARMLKKQSALMDKRNTTDLTDAERERIRREIRGGN